MSFGETESVSWQPTDDLSSELSITVEAVREARFADPFQPCASEPLPDSFGAGEGAETCLVFFAAPDAVAESVTFQPTVESPTVSWIGDVAAPTRKPAPVQKPMRKPKRR